MAAMQLSTVIIAGQPVAGDSMPWLRLLAGFDIIFTLLAVTLIDTVLIG
jgi:hypothetical protein